RMTKDAAVLAHQTSTLLVIALVKGVVSGLLRWRRTAEQVASQVGRIFAGHLQVGHAHIAVVGGRLFDVANQRRGVPLLLDECEVGAIADRGVLRSLVVTRVAGNATELAEPFGTSLHLLGREAGMRLWLSQRREVAGNVAGFGI